MLTTYHNFKHHKSYAIIGTFVLCLAWTGLAHGQQVDALLYRLRHETTDRPDWGEAMALRVVQNEGIEPLVEALRTDEEPAVRGAAAEALGLVGDEQGVETLRAIQPLTEVLQQDRATSVRRAAAEALGDIGDKRAIPALTEALRQDLARVRQVAAAALGRIDDEQSIAVLVSTLQRDDGPDVRAAAAEALGLIGEEQAVEPLIEAMQQDESHKVRSAAAEALESVKR